MSKALALKTAKPAPATAATTASDTPTSSMDALQSVLMQTLLGVSNGTLDPADAKVINSLVQTAFNGAKIQAEVMRLTQRTTHKFFDPGALPSTTHLTSDIDPPPQSGSHWRGLGK